MPLTRRETLGLAGAAFAGAVLPSGSKAEQKKINTVIFDAFTQVRKSLGIEFRH